MVYSGADGLRTTRRALLGGVAGVAAVGNAPRITASSHDLRVMTRNLYVGVDLFSLAVASDLDDVRQIAGQLLDEARAHPYEARIEALAAEVAATEPDVVGVQEASLIRTREPSAFDGEHDPGASDVLVDLLERFENALSARGLEYELATSTVTNDVEVPAATDAGDVDIRLTDQTAIFVREDVAIEDTRADRFDAALRFPLDGTEISLKRGFCQVDLTVAGEVATVATTHLESFDPSVRREQAEELLDQLPAARPIVLAGDVNSGPDDESDAYDVLRKSFRDAVETVHPATNVDTCCHDTDLRSDADALSRRVDVVLHRGELRPTNAEIVGADPEARVPVDEEGETVRLWPSDHAGVVATFEFGARAETAMPAQTPASTGSPTGTEFDADDQQPESQSGPGLFVVVAGAVVAALERRRRAD